ncbi:peptidoglycan D,D-transpeptidase FtsI family protein [Aliarcobacter skirrowii]|uniref:peptidoglycan D,D-transpeptidase FtsI family protein n=1 Tax=Aliarcobacter skirrowii TaxID=28200 RepID=UPI000836EEFF|nr:penicillin-binding protein 2 [Aliarcobacter skirrowii]MDX4039988.1 penicillin-binding protein 2 [Aliarcobacter skirrowii]
MTSNIDFNTYKISELKKKSKKFSILIFLLTIPLFIVAFSIFNTIKDNRKIPRIAQTKNELAVRGNIISQDGFNLVSSKKLYKAVIDTRYLDFKKEELFLSLFSIYSGLDYNELKKKLLNSKKRPGNLVLSYSIDSKAAKNLEELDLKLNSLKVFVPIKGDNSSIIRRLEISESGEKRDFRYKDTLSPILGYVQKEEDDQGKTRSLGIKGLENFYNENLNDLNNGILQGYRDISGYLYFDKNSTTTHAIDGYSLKLNIPLKLQKNNEATLDKHKIRTQSDEIILAIVENRSGKILSMASSNRFIPDNIKPNEIPILNVNAVEYQFEPGSVIKPLSISLALDKNRVKKNESFPSSNIPNRKRQYAIGNYIIRDSHRFDDIVSLEDTIIYSSNIATIQIAQRIPAYEFYEGMKSFGFTQKTGIDLSYEKTGAMPPLIRFAAGEKENKDNIFKATVSYGQGMTATFMQLVKAFTVFSNDGFMLTPYIVDELIKANRVIKEPFKKEPVQVLSKDTTNFMRNLLIRTVEEGTGRGAKIDGLEIGGKTGTAQIAGGGTYIKKYISSFIGFVNDDKGNSYTIGVTVINPTTDSSSYYASQAAVPIFKETIQNLVKLNYLSPKKDIISKN